MYTCNHAGTNGADGDKGQLGARGPVGPRGERGLPGPRGRGGEDGRHGEVRTVSAISMIIYNIFVYLYNFLRYLGGHPRRVRVAGGGELLC